MRTIVFAIVTWSTVLSAVAHSGAYAEINTVDPDLEAIQTLWADFEQAQAHRLVIREHYSDLFQRHGAGILVTPTLGCEAFPHGSIHPHKIDDTHIELPWLDWASFLYDANLAGMPACAIPIGVGDEGLPLSLQILGQEGSDLEVLRVAEAIESLIGWDNSIVTPDGDPLDQTA